MHTVPDPKWEETKNTLRKIECCNEKDKNEITTIIASMVFLLSTLYGAEVKNHDEKVLSDWVDVELSPVDSRPGSRWMKLWLDLERPWQGGDISRHWFASLIEDQRSDLTALVIISNEENHAVLHTAKVNGSPVENKPDVVLPIEHRSIVIDRELAIKINSISLKELYKVKYSASAGRTTVMGGTRVTLGADSRDQPYAYFTGKCSMSDASPLKWIEDITVMLLHYGEAKDEEKVKIEKRIHDIIDEREKDFK